MRTVLRFRRALLKRVLPWLVAVVALIAVVWLIYSPYRRDLHQTQVDANVGPLVQGQIFTQEFRSNLDNLARIDVVIGARPGGGDSTLILELYSDPRDEDSYRVVSVETAELVDNTYFRWTFDALPESGGRKFVLSAWSPDADSNNSVTLSTSTTNAYPEGLAAINGNPRPSESLVFSTYSYLPVGQMLVRSGGGLVPVLPGHIGILAGLLGPGLILWSLFRQRASVLNDMPLVLGMSLALSATLLIWGLTSPARISADYLLFGLILLILGVALALLRTIREAADVSWWSLLTMVVAFATAATRLALYGRQQFPFAGDSVQHAIATELFRRDAHLPSSWHPFALLDSFTLEFGFHNWAGDLARALDMSPQSAVVTFGFVLLGLTAMSSAYLAERLCDRPLAGPCAALLTGFLMPFPSTLLDWGQYSQIFSLIILALLVAFSVEALSNDLSWRQVPVFSLLLLGILVSDLQAAVLGAIWVFALILVILTQRRSAVRLLSATGLSAVLSLPWLIRLFINPQALNAMLPEPSGWSTAHEVMGESIFFTPVWALGAAVIGGIILSISHFSRALVMLLWIGFCWVFASVEFPILPVGLSIEPFYLQSSAYVILIPLAAVTFAWIGEVVFVLISRATAGQNIPLGSRRANWGRPLAAERESPALVLRPSVLPTMVAIILCFTVALSTNQAVAPDHRYRLMYDSDLKAVEWLKENIDEGDKVLAMSEISDRGSTIVGTDAGWWLPLMGIGTQLPPVVYLTERLSPIQSEWIELMSTDHDSSRALDPDRWIEHGFEYLFVGVANRWKQISPARPVKLVYEQDGVRIYDLRPE